MDSYVDHRIKNDGQYANASRQKQITDFIDKNKRKPELAYEAASIITNGRKDASNIPDYFVRVLKAIETLAKSQVVVTDGNTEKKPE